MTSQTVILRIIRIMRKVTATELQRNAREVIDQVRVRHEAVVVENRGKPMAAVLPYEEYERWQQYVDQREKDFRRLLELAESKMAANQGLNDDEAMALARQAIQEYREERRRGALA